MSLCIELTFARLTIYTLFSLLLLCRPICRTGAADLFGDQPMDLYEDYGFDVDEAQNSGPSFSRAIHDNGMLHLVLRHLALRLIKEMEINKETRFNQKQSEMLQEKITGFYDDILKHPALSNNRVAFSPKKPDFKNFSKLDSDENNQQKRRSSTGHLAAICPSETRWTDVGEIRMGITQSHSTVELFPGQIFRLTRCTEDREEAECNFIANGITSECRTLTSWTRAYVSNGDGGHEWQDIAIGICCSCAARQNYG